MTSTQVPDINFLMEPLSDLQPVMAIKPRFVRLLQLDHFGWIKQFRYDGFTDADIESLEAFQHESFNEMELAERLAHLLQGVHDITEGSDVDHVMAQWISHSGWPGRLGNRLREEVSRPHRRDRIHRHTPDQHRRHHAGVRNPSNEIRSARKTSTGSADDSEIREGIVLAESGLAEEASEWPPY